MSEEFPPIQGGGSLLLAWQVRGKKVIVVGGGEVAAGRILNLLNADADVTVICPREGLNAETRHRVAEQQVKHVDRAFLTTDLDDPLITMVLCAVDDPKASSAIYKECSKRRIPANIADVPPECDFYFGSVHRDGPLQIMVSTNGNGPKLASIVRKQIASSLPQNLGDAIVKVGELRKRLREVAPETSESPKRMRWMSQVCEQWSLEDLCQLDDQDAEMLLKFYAAETVPSLEKLRNRQGRPSRDAFDGSFGWCNVM